MLNDLYIKIEIMQIEQMCSLKQRLLFVVFIAAVVMTREVYAQEENLALPGCQLKCGNTNIPYPFGIGANCSGNSNFEITCNTSYTPAKPFLGNTSVEVLEISFTDYGLGPRTTIELSNPDIQNERLPQFTSSNSQTRFTAVLDWGPYWDCTRKPNESSFASCGKNAECGKDRIGYCNCIDGFAGNPYTPNGCVDIDECSDKWLNWSRRGRSFYYNGSYLGYNLCNHRCVNSIGSYNCNCFGGYKQNRSGHWCYPDNKTKNAIIGTFSGIGGLILLALIWRSYKLLKRRKIKKLKEKYFKKNGGLLLQQQISSSKEGNVEKCKLFTSKELEKATDHYNEDRILGQGGQGTVYKGMLTDGKIVAVKKSKIEDESELEPFINEVVILSKIDHRNIVKLHGCCLETEVPLLVYEFIPNGTLFQYIHDQNEDFPLSWDVRVRVAKEIAGALFYLHSAASLPIYHRDIKSTNILLDAKFKAKVADFGTSRSTAIDQTHFTTRVQGTFGYLDPEYFQSSQFTDKSDVYSFGVVLVELLTGKKPILSGGLEDEGRSLATFFILAMEQDRLWDILDPRVMQEGEKEEVLRFAKLAHRCLNLNGRKRPTMKQVSMELEAIAASSGETIPHQHYDEVEYATVELMGPWETSTSSVEFSRILTTSTHVQEDPLLHVFS